MRVLVVVSYLTAQASGVPIQSGGLVAARAMMLPLGYLLEPWVQSLVLLLLPFLTLGGRLQMLVWALDLGLMFQWTGFMTPMRQRIGEVD